MYTTPVSISDQVMNALIRIMSLTAKGGETETGEGRGVSAWFMVLVQHHITAPFSKTQQSASISGYQVIESSTNNFSAVALLSECLHERRWRFLTEVVPLLVLKASRTSEVQLESSFIQNGANSPDLRCKCNLEAHRWVFRLNTFHVSQYFLLVYKSAYSYIHSSVFLQK